jgi:ornithine cyclodeaminase/alanine dehydrogenase-like protein (mu-crystallin family)
MAGADGKYFGAKIYATHVKHGAHFLVLLYRAEDARPLALMEANYLGQIRTGAVSGYATRLLSRADSKTLGVIGSGFQARSQVDAVKAVRGIETIKVWSRSEDKRTQFASETGGNAVSSAEEAVRGSDIVITATYSKDPVLEDGWIVPGTHINAIGSNQSDRRELPAETVRRAGLIAVDSIEQARVESGDLLLGLDQNWGNVMELKELAVLSDRPDLTIFKSNGLAVEDIIAAGYLYEKAVDEGRGRNLPVFAYS